MSTIEIMARGGKYKNPYEEAKKKVEKEEKNKEWYIKKGPQEIGKLVKKRDNLSKIISTIEEEGTKFNVPINSGYIYNQDYEEAEKMLYKLEPVKKATKELGYKFEPQRLVNDEYNQYILNTSEGTRRKLIKPPEYQMLKGTEPEITDVTDIDERINNIINYISNRELALQQELLRIDDKLSKASDPKEIKLLEDKREELEDKKDELEEKKEVLKEKTKVLKGDEAKKLNDNLDVMIALINKGSKLIEDPEFTRELLPKLTDIKKYKKNIINYFDLLETLDDSLQKKYDLYDNEKNNFLAKIDKLLINPDIKKTKRNKLIELKKALSDVVGKGYDMFFNPFNV